MSHIFRSILFLSTLSMGMLLSACGGGGGGGEAATPSGSGTGDTTPTSPPSLALFAGNTGGRGNADGIGTAARFNFPEGIAADSAGNVYVADTNNQIIRKITPAGAVTTLAGVAGVPGSIDGTGTTAHFNFPRSITTDSAGNVFVADSSNSTIRKITPAGVVTTFAGTSLMSGSADGTGTTARFLGPRGIAIDSTDNLYVSDTFNHTIRKITPAGVVTTLAGTAGMMGSADGTEAAARFNLPRGIATDSVGNIYVSDTGNRTIRKITPVGVVSTFAGTPLLSGSIDGTGAAAGFFAPLGLTIDSTGNTYVTDGFTIRMITPAGVVTTLAGSANSDGSTDGTGAAARFTFPAGIAADSSGNLYVADTFNSIIRKVTLAGIVTTFAGEDNLIGRVDGTGSAARFTFPRGLTADSAGNVYVADTSNHTIRKITPAGAVTTFAGSPSVIGDYVDDTGAAARFNSPTGVATDSIGNIYVADTGNNAIRKITPAGVVTSLAGTKVNGSTDGTGVTASFRGPSGVATDSTGNIYVADTGNNTIRKITPEGVVTTLAGTANVVGGSSDATGVAASFNGPYGIATDSVSNVYVSDTGNNTIRKITPAGVVTTFAGMAGTSGSTDATGVAARFRFPQGIATDSVDNIYVADLNHTIRKITPTGSVSTVVGVTGQSSFVPGILPGLLAQPRGVAVSGNLLYITLYSGVAVVQNRP